MRVLAATTPIAVVMGLESRAAESRSIPVVVA